MLSCRSDPKQWYRPRRVFDTRFNEYSINRRWDANVAIIMHKTRLRMHVVYLFTSFHRAQGFTR